MVYETHSIKVAGTNFEVDKKYTFIKPIGSGAYGIVISALNTETNEQVAIKKIPNVFSEIVDAKRILREIKLLREFDHENIISVCDILPPKSVEEFEDVYIVSDLMETDLHRIIYSQQDLSLEHVQYFIYQVLRALKYMHSANVLHRDLKPSNLLLNSNCDLKVCDLGLARSVGKGGSVNDIELTEYVVTRWYRAPEIMLSCQEYTKAIDIWSIGCIFAELLNRKAMFPGDDYIDQLRVICEKLGRPDESELNFITSDKAKRFILSLPTERTVPKFESHFPKHDNPQAMDLLRKMLQFHPTKRITVEEALRHPFMESLHNEEDEPVSTSEFSFEFENTALDKKKLQILIWNEMTHYHNEYMLLNQDF